MHDSKSRLRPTAGCCHLANFQRHNRKAYSESFTTIVIKFTGNNFSPGGNICDTLGGGCYTADLTEYREIYYLLIIY